MHQQPLGESPLWEPERVCRHASNAPSTLLERTPVWLMETIYTGWGRERSFLWPCKHHKHSVLFVTVDGLRTPSGIPQETQAQAQAALEYW